MTDQERDQGFIDYYLAEVAKARERQARPDSMSSEMAKAELGEQSTSRPESLEDWISYLERRIEVLENSRPSITVESPTVNVAPELVMPERPPREVKFYTNDQGQITGADIR